MTPTRALMILLGLFANGCAGPHGDASAPPSGGTPSGTTPPTAGTQPSGGGQPMGSSTTLPLASAPALDGVMVIPNRSSVVLTLPAVTGAMDYRVFAVEDGVAVQVDGTGREHIDGATLHCSGLRQRNQCDDGEILPVTYNNDLLDMPKCEVDGLDRRPNVPAQLMQTVEVDGIGPNTTLVVEAIDRQCPFPGLFGVTHVDTAISHTDFPGDAVDATVNGKAYSLEWFQPTFPVQTESEIRAMYGSMILNGEAPNQPTLDPKSPAFPESPYIRVGQPAPPNDPKVLARAVITVSPTGTAQLPDGFTSDDTFDDFDDPSDQPVLLRKTDPATAISGDNPINVYQMKNWILYDVSNQFSQFFVDRGQLNLVMGDPYQDSMSTQAFYPKRPVQLPTASDEYLHVTYEVQRNETSRRYENLTLCGADVTGQTYVGDAPATAPVPRPGFMDEDNTARSNPLGWNCLYLVPRGEGYGVVAGGQGIASHTDTSLKVTVARTQPPPAPGQYDAQRIGGFATSFGPTQEGPLPLLWERQIDDQHNPSGVWLDDVTHVWQRTKFDVFIRRDRVFVYVNGQQRMCANLASSPLTMAEGALGFWHILYHTSAEFNEIRAGYDTANPSTGQHHIMHNTPFADQRAYDNVGFRENVAAPADFDVARCY